MYNIYPDLYLWLHSSTWRHWRTWHLVYIALGGGTGLTCEGDASEGEGGGQHHREHPGLVLGGEAGQREGQADEHLHHHCSVCDGD